TATPAGPMPRMRRLQVIGTFASGMFEYDRGLALVALEDAARLFQLGDAVSGIRLLLDEPHRAPVLTRQLALELGGGFYVSDWTRQQANFFRSIELSKAMLFVILLMIVAVAAFNLVASLVMIVKEKQADIAILRAFGAAPSHILATFALLGALIGTAGTLGGALLGIAGAHNVARFVRGLDRLAGAPLLDARVYLMSDLPARVEWQDVVQVCGIAMLLCAFATLYPAWRAARTAPAQALRHE
ncbi:MAG: FtsX-like permease family protein, partial [Steroidobacteraceae bacterium]|nr:FtsX-like permease family protein [Steroidobacteraceae bacterium]MDW8259608.1 FtsX-like permease family protein [Gammaproteobacteria bacterium]